MMSQEIAGSNSLNGLKFVFPSRVTASKGLRFVFPVKGNQKRDFPGCKSGLCVDCNRKLVEIGLGEPGWLGFAGVDEDAIVSSRLYVGNEFSQKFATRLQMEPSPSAARIKSSA